MEQTSQTISQLSSYLPTKIWFIYLHTKTGNISYFQSFPGFSEHVLKYGTLSGLILSFLWLSFVRWSPVLNDAGWHFLLVKVFQNFYHKKSWSGSGFSNSLVPDPDTVNPETLMTYIYSQRAPTCPLLAGRTRIPAWPIACSSVSLIRIPDPGVKKKALDPGSATLMNTTEQQHFSCGGSSSWS